MLKRLFLFTILVGLIVAGCSNDDQLSGNIVSPEDNLSTNGDFESFIAQIIDSEEESSFTGTESSLKSGRYGYSPVYGPATITEPGIYYLAEDFSTEDVGITIQSDFVILLLGSKTITGPGNKAGIGVFVENAKRVAVFGGIFNMIGTSVMFDNTTHSTVRYIEVTGGDEFADPANDIAPQIGIMLKNSSYNIVMKNHISLINLGIFVRGDGSSRNRIFLNAISGGDMGLLGICYNPIPDENSSGPQFDHVARNRIERFGVGIQATAGSMYNKFFYNTIKYFNLPFEDNDGTNRFFRNHSEQLNPPNSSMLSLQFDRLEDLGDDFVYEGWLIVDGAPVSTGTFTINSDGNPSQTDFFVNTEDLTNAVKFVLTIEPDVDPDPMPASTHVLAGDFSGSSASLTASDPAALGNDFLMATGPYILNTPSTGSDNDDYHAGIWWLDPNAGPGATLDLPELPEGWVYEGWVVGETGPVTTGKFSKVDMLDFDAGGPTAGPDGVPPFPGQDYINPLMSLIGYAAVISIEPMPDNSADPFAFKPLVDMNIDDVGIGVLQSMDNNAGSFPEGNASR